MSQYPPYPPGTPSYYTPPGIDFSQYMPPAQMDLLAPARKAAILQGVLGCLMLACGVCVGSVFWIVDPAQAAAQANFKLEELTRGQSVEMLRASYTVLGAGGLLIGITMLVLAIFVRAGGIVSAILSIVVCSLVALFLLINVVGSVILSGGNPAMALGGLLFSGVPLALFGLNIAWLIRAARNGGQVAMARQQYQMQYMHYQQQHQAYAQQPQAYGYPPPPAQPNAAPPSPPPPNPQA